jgi:hypothetical protein
LVVLLQVKWIILYWSFGGIHFNDNIFNLWEWSRDGYLLRYQNSATDNYRRAQQIQIQRATLSDFQKRKLYQNAFSNFEFRYGLSPFQFIGPENGGKIYMAHKQKCWHASAPQGGYGLAL